MGNEQHIRLALPSKGQLEEPTLAFLKSCGLHISKLNPRQYIAHMPAMPQVEVLFQRPADIASKVRDGDVSLGITGYDIVAEGEAENEQMLVLYDNLGFGGCDLVLAVPEGWIDINSTADLADLALSMWEQGRRLRIATKYTNLVREFLHHKGLTHFVLVEAEGALEAAPRIGYADIIADLSATGTTLRENRLKILSDGIILHSEACLIGNRVHLSTNKAVLEVARYMLEMIEARERGRRYHSLRANVTCSEPARLTAQIAQYPAIAGLRGPAIAPIYDANGDCAAMTVSIVVRDDQLRDAIAQLRALGSTEMIVSPVEYIFRQSSEAFDNLLRKLRQ